MGSTGGSGPDSPRPDAWAISAGLRAWLSRRFDGELVDADPPSVATGGFDHSTTFFVLVAPGYHPNGLGHWSLG